jgi:hypothetical protein
VQRYLFIISRREPEHMYQTMRESFAGHADVEVIVDRRSRERRWQTIPIEVNRRSRERRTADIDALLQRVRWVVVAQRTDDA